MKKSSTKYSNGTAIKIEWMFTNTMIQHMPLKLKFNCLAKQESTLIYLNDDEWKEESLSLSVYGNWSKVWFYALSYVIVVAGQLLKWRK